MINTLEKSVGTLVLATALCVATPGCSWSVGGKKGGSTVVKPSKGQELIDLQRAHDSGAIDDAEYERLKEELVNE